MSGYVFLFAYLLPILPAAVGAGIWFRDDPDARSSPGLLGFVCVMIGLLWPLVIPIAAFAALCIVFGEWVKDFRR